MPRAPVAGREIRRRSRNGCWNCKARKVKCGEEKPRCSNCERLDEDCDYKIRLSWGGRPLKKKQLESAANGQDPNPDDQSQFIPGAGQFSINQHFPSPQTFVQTTHNNGTSRKPPVPRIGNGKKTTMSNYQTVFSVAEPQTPTHSQPVMQTAVQAPLDPQLRVPNGRPPPLQQPLQQPQTPIMHPRNGSNPYDWEQGLTPTTGTPHSTSYDGEVMYKTEHQQVLYSPYTPVSSSFVPQVTSPVSSHSNGYVHSPPASVASPTGNYAQPHNSPPLQKSYHAPPTILTSPTKRLRTSTSPTQPPPNSPYIYGGTNGHAVSMPPHTTSIGTALDYMPTSGIQMAHHMELMDRAAVTGVGTNTIMRRVSVENLLAAPLPNSDTSYSGGSFVDRFSSDLDEFKRDDPQKGMHFGVDNGDPDLDQDSDVEEIPRHSFDFSGQSLSRYNHHGSRMYPSGARGSSGGGGGGGVFGLNPNSPFYPVQITIPRRLDPLPQLLLENKKNMMYFHHYLHYTARLLVPHDCSENPFKSILPQMAVQTDHLMNLLLAYSASHRARLLEHKEPTERIGRFLDETVRSLKASLDDPDTAKSDSTLATAIMLSSYQIISPTPFNMADLNITWQTHLSAARKIILARGGAQGMHSRDKVSYFLVRWFAYLDLLGSLSGREIDEPFFSGKYWTNDDGNDEQEEYSVDCFFGFTGRCVSILAKIGELARQCEAGKREFLAMPPMPSRNTLAGNRFDPWRPTLEIQTAATALQKELEDARGKASGHCNHTHHQTQHFRTGSPTGDSDASELLATNDAFHWAALVHLYRRVLNYDTYHPRVQNAVAQIVSAMLKVRHGGTAENCLLFPLFSAGCEAMEQGHRDYTLTRMKEVEKSGLTQVRHARLLMQRVWGENRPWWEMADGEFIG